MTFLLALRLPNDVKESTYNQAFFWTFQKKLKAKKTQAEKKLKQIFEKLKQIIQKLNNLPTKN